MKAGDSRHALPAELDAYMRESISSLLGLRSSEELLKQERRSTAEASDRNLAWELQVVQLRLQELEHKWAKAKEEALLNAQALKRQVSEGQKLAEQYSLLKEECRKLERECALYHNDRDMFMEAAYEAEDRAADAEDRAVQAQKKSELLTEELERLSKALAQDSCARLETGDTGPVTPLKRQVTALEEQNGRREGELFESSFQEIQKELDEATGQVPLAVTQQGEQAIHEMVASAVTAGTCRALEEEKADSLRVRDMEFASIFKCLESELNGSRERAKVAEMNVQGLLQEAQSLRQEAALCRENLDKAEDEVQMLADENKELRILLNLRYVGFESLMSPRQNRGIEADRSPSSGRHRAKTCEVHGEEGICMACNGRQPLMPLPANSVEMKLKRQTEFCR